MSDEERYNLIRQQTPIPINDFPYKPYKTIIMVNYNYLLYNVYNQIFFLLISGLLFLYQGLNRYIQGEGWSVYIPYGILGSLLFYSGAFYTFIITCIVFGFYEYTYDDLPDLSNN